MIWAAMKAARLGVGTILKQTSDSLLDEEFFEQENHLVKVLWSDRFTEIGGLG